MKKTLNLWKMAFLAVFFSILACREEIEWTKNQQEQSRTEEFFRHNDVIGKSQNASFISNSIEKLKSNNGKTDFLSSLSDKSGLPVWNYMLDANMHTGHNHGTANKDNEETTETLVIPLKQEDNFLTSVMYVENPNSESPTIYTVTNENLKDFVKNEAVDKESRENVLMTFVYFDHEIFGERKYSSIPEDLFENIPLKEGLSYKSFSVENTEVTTTSNRQQMICFESAHCVGCIGPCDGCRLCVSTSCYTTGSPGPGGPSTPGTPGDTGGGGSGGGTGNPNTPSIPWYLMNPDVDIYTYNGNVRNVFKKLTDFNIVLQKEQLDYLQNKSALSITIYNCLSNNTFAKSKFIDDMLNEYAFAYPQLDANVLNSKLNTFHSYIFNIYPNIDWGSFKTYFFVHNLSTNELNNILSTGYSSTYISNIKKLSPSEFNELIQVNLSITSSPYEEEYIKETNEAFAAFTAYADIETMTDAQMEYVLNNNCCVGLFFNALAKEKAKLIAANYRFNRKFYPEWSKSKCFWEASRETIQLMLDLGGLVPVIGEVCDITNGVIYTIQGDGLNATLSYSSAIPVAGWAAFGAKMGVKVVNKTASHIASRQVLKWIVGTDGLIKFGYRSQLRKVLQLTDKLKQAHHIIPWEFSNYAIVQKAAKSSNAFHMNDFINGIPLPTTGHLTGHSVYNAKLQEILLDLNSKNPNMSPNEAYNHLQAITNQIKTLIQNNPNYNLGQIANLIKYP